MPPIRPLAYREVVRKITSEAGPTMRRDEALKVLSEHKSELRQKFGVKSIAIFGSTARGEVTPQSDIDVLVEFNPLAAPSLLDFIHLKHFLSDKLNGKVDLVERRSLIPELRDAILAESVDV